MEPPKLISQEALEVVREAQASGVWDWRQLSPSERSTTLIVPDRLCVEPSSKWFCPILTRRVGVKLNGVTQTRVIEYSMSEGWVRRYTGSKKTGIRVSKNGRVVAFKVTGKVVAYLQPLPDAA